MVKIKEVKLPSGAILKIGPVPFADARALYQSLLLELKGIEIDSKMELAVLYKNLFCCGFSSPKIESHLWKCMERSTYNELKIDQDTFEPVEARQDYLTVCMEVAKEHISPFVKSLSVDFGAMFAEMANIPK